MMALNFIPRSWLRAAFVLLICLAGSSALQALTSGDFTYTATATEVTITDCSQESGAVTIPATIAGLPVKVIDSYAFHNKYGLTSVTIPNSVTSIGFCAFTNCTGLTSLTIPNSVTSIGESAFQYCTSLTSVTIPNSITSIDVRSFYYCTSLTSLTIPSSVTSIGFCAFQSCSDLTSVTLPNSITSIGPGAFCYCLSLTNLTIPSSVTSIGSGAFNYCISLANVTIPDSVTSIEESAFSYCTALTSLTIGSGVTSIINSTFSDCTGLRNVSIPDSVTSIARGAFAGCSGVTSLKIPYIFLASLPTIGFDGPVATSLLIDGIAKNLSTNTEFINALAGNDAFVTAVANKIKSTSGNYGIATQSALSSALTESRADGINRVLSNPNLWTLYTTSQIQNMAVGDLVLTKNVQGHFTLNYDIEQSADLQTWTPYQALSLPLTGLPTDKAFVRIKAKP